jgi:hypothetical protein
VNLENSFWLTIHVSPELKLRRKKKNVQYIQIDPKKEETKNMTTTSSNRSISSNGCLDLLEPTGTMANLSMSHEIIAGTQSDKEKPVAAMTTETRVTMEAEEDSAEFSVNTIPSVKVIPIDFDIILKCNYNDSLVGPGNDSLSTPIIAVVDRFDEIQMSSEEEDAEEEGTTTGQANRKVKKTANIKLQKRHRRSRNRAMSEEEFDIFVSDIEPGL